MDLAQDSVAEVSKDELSTEELQKQRREKKPFFYCRIVTNHPYKSFFVALGIQIGIVMTTGILFLSGYDLFPTSFDTLPMELYSIPYRLRDYANRDKDNYDDAFVRQLDNTGFPSWERGLRHSLSSLDLYYSSEGGNIFTRETFQLMQQVENDLVTASGYSSSWCQTNSSSLACVNTVSILRYFDGTYSGISATFNDPTFSNIPSVLYEAYTNTQTKADFEFFLPKSFVITATRAEGTITRSILPVGCSVSGTYLCKNMKNVVGDFLQGPMKDKLESWREKLTSFDFWYYSYILWNKDVIAQAMTDMMLALGSMVFIFSFMTYHTKSLWIAGFAIISIITSFLGGNLIYRVIFDFRYFGFFHILAIFIALGIGADDLFVFFDAWRLTSFHSYPSLAHRLSDAFNKSAQSMATTSLTTIVAFLCSAISPLLATKSFGVFAAITIFFNYMSVIIFFPCVVTVYHLKFEHFKWPCFRCCRKKTSDSSENDKVNNNSVKPMQSIFVLSDGKSDITTNEKIGQTVHKDLDDFPQKQNGQVPNGHVSNGHVTNGIANGHMSNGISNGKANTVNKTDGTTSKPNDKQTRQTDRSKEKKLVIFFRDYYFRFITHRIARWCLLPVFVVVVAVFAYQASTLEPDNENMQVWKDSHHYSKAIDAEQYDFYVSADENLVTVHILWGLKNKDRSNCHFSDITCVGDNVYDDSFDPNPVANQQAIMDFCSSLYSMSASTLAEYEIKTDSSGNPEIACFTRDLTTFLSNITTALSIDVSLPWDYTKVSNLMTAESTHYDVSQFNSNFPNILEIAVQYWMYNGYAKTFTDDYATYNSMFGEEKGAWSKQLLSDTSIYYGNKMKYMMVSINTTINRFTTGYAEGIPKVERWENFIQSEVGKMPTGLQGGFQLTRSIWHWLYIQKEMEKNAVTGIAVGVSLAFPILCLSTMNVIVGSLATLSICCTTICVIGVIPTAGWRLGLLTSLNMTMLVGLAVDYVVHLAEGYRNSLHKDRLHRTRDMLEEMATSVFSGACTTLGAALFMFLAKITFFMQFGIFLFCTIGFSLFFSLGLFSVLMGLIGPQNDTGSLRPIFNFIKRTLKKCLCWRKSKVVNIENGDSINNTTHQK
ncbi:protein dispatched homolog 3-like [Mizuhopecten yessoensis]|uniref:Protein dispatched-like 1 n=1 Tax=Mizuhopecten yessoensis TaxID=6573 RepID=A0A210R352_MIZYE|nr:protein dispatched homolog 3-like [Mizuhopecten yessoensis]XP_021368739.1 protein dispatched homolog 3-like [Mizuhopecten yessoensis]OWF55417.1 Protein dispatched-like 1 [Mizuhopecten yessoensis]